MDKKAISKKLDRISRALLEAKTFYEMWWVLRGPTRPKYVDIMNEYGSYSRALITTTFYTTVIALYKVTDKRSHNLEDVFKSLPTDKFTVDDVQSYRAVMAKHKKIIKAVGILRNNAFGHNSVSLDYDAAFTKAGFVPNECKEYIADLVTMICAIYSKHENLVHEAFFKSKAADELESVFQELMNHAAKAG